jgi:hypothetical protein
MVRSHLPCWPGDLETVRGVRYCRMAKALSSDDAHSEKLLGLAGLAKSRRRNR